MAGYFPDLAKPTPGITAGKGESGDGGRMKPDSRQRIIANPPSDVRAFRRVVARHDVREAVRLTKDFRLRVACAPLRATFRSSWRLQRWSRR